MHMKRTIFLLIFFSLVSIIYGQTGTDQQNKAAISEKTKVTKNRNMGLEVSAGLSLVMGNYGVIDKENTKAGYATNGWQLQLTFDWMGKKNFGLAIQYTFQKNPLDDSTAFLVPNGWSGGTLGPGNWMNHYLMVGPVFMKQFGKVHVDAKLLVGVIVSSSDNFTTQNPYDSTGVKKDVNLGTGFAYGISAGVGYAFSKQLAIKLNFGILGGWPGKNKGYPSQWLGTEEVYDPLTGLYTYIPVYSAPVEYEIKKVVTSFNPSLGIVYRF
jgi:hypothetical protein